MHAAAVGSEVTFEHDSPCKYLHNWSIKVRSVGLQTALLVLWELLWPAVQQ